MIIMSDEIDVTKMNTLVADLRKAVDSKDADSAETKQKIEKLTTDILDMEEKNQKLVTEIAESKKVEEELKKNYSSLEQQINLMPNGAAKDEKSVELKAYEKFVTKGPSTLTDEERKYLRTDVNPDGGYLAPPEYVNEITKKITEISPIRSVARIRTTSTPRMFVPKRTSLVTAYWVGEGASSTASKSQYGATDIKVEKLTGETRITLEELMESAFNMESEISQDMAEQFAQKEGAAFVNGTGPAANMPEGFMSVTGISEINSGAASDITMDSIIEVTGQLKTGYNPMYAFNRRTFAKILTLKGNDQYYWTGGNIAAGVPNQLVGHEYLITPDLPDVSAGTYPVVFADFARGYTVVDHTMLLTIRDDYTLASEGKVRFFFHRFVGGAVELKEAFVKIKISA